MMIEMKPHLKLKLPSLDDYLTDKFHHDSLQVELQKIKPKTLSCELTMM